MHDLTLARRGVWTAVEDESELISAARSDPAAFAELYRRYVARVYRYLFSFLGDAQETEDLTATVFTAAWESLPRYREQGNFAAWLFRIARNKTNDFYRRRKPQVSLDQVGERLREDWDPFAQLELNEALERLSTLVSELDPEHLELLRLRFAADLSYAEIGRLVGRSEDAIKMAIHRLLRRLQDQWEKCDA